MPYFKFLGQVALYKQENDRIRRKITQEKKSFGNSQSEMKMDDHWLDASRTLLQKHRSLIGERNRSHFLKVNQVGDKQFYPVDKLIVLTGFKSSYVMKETATTLPNEV